MSEAASGRSADNSGSPARASRRKATEGEERRAWNRQDRVASPSLPHTIEHQYFPEEIHHDDSFSEERFASLPAGSWESQSFDSEPGRHSRPSSRTSFRDRRKQFDLTTPTLMDEDDEGYQEDQEIVSLEQRLRTHTLDDSAVDSELSLRRTPGASMYKSSYDETSLSDVASMRRTPGATAMHRSGPPGEQQEKDGASLGFSLTLSTPVASSDETHRSGRDKSRMWVESSSAPDLKSDVTEQQQTRPPLAPTPTAAVVGATSTSGQGQPEPRGLFSLAPWTRAGSHATSSATVEGRAFSPNTLRLREDLGNLLQDEDDDYALEIPSAFRGTADDNNSNKSEYSEDWTGSYVFDSSNRSSKPTITRNYANQKEGRSRRQRSGANQQQQQQANLVPQAQQPTPRQSGNEVFVFGQTRGDDRKSPQLLNFRGAFAPPANSGAFMRPVASSAVGGSAYESSFTPAGRQGSFQVGQSTSMGLQGFQAQTFNTYQQGHLQEPMRPPSTEQIRRFSPTPGHFVSADQQYSHHLSEMQATAREFIPMARTISTQVPTQVSTQQWPQQHYEMGQHSWHGGGVASARFVPTYGYTLPSQSFSDTRSSMTPSPHLTGWQQQDPNIYGTAHAIQVDQHQHYSQPASNPTPTPSQHSQASTDPSQRDTQQRKQTIKRGKRGKKKSQREKSESSGKKSPIKKKGQGDGGRPASTTQSHDGNADEGAVSASEDPVDLKRAELDESPATRVAFKDFYRSFRGEERISPQKAEMFALQVIDAGTLPQSVHWRVYLELADLAKRSNRFAEARQLYQRVCQLQPYAFQGWLEYSKLEEECGNLNRVMNILHAGLEHCEHNETLMTRAVKLQEKMGNLGMARALLARLKHVGIDKVWKTVLEGALVEARAGNVTTARRVLKYLMHHVPWYGPLYLEAYRLERDQGNIEEALLVVERGLSAIPRYGPLWFGAFRLCEEMDFADDDFYLPTAMAMIDRATGCISKELVWKVHLEAALMYERAALLQASVDDPEFDDMLYPSRRRLALTVTTCPDNLRWKVWLSAARSELGFGNTGRARALFLRAHKAVPDKGRSATILECARMEEFLADTPLARAILCRGRLEYGHDWKVWLESVLLEIRDRQYGRAIQICAGALEIHSGTGRLWACLVQLQQFSGGARTQLLALKRALNAVPKSGEVWCEGGRIHLNPFSSTFDLDRARRHLYFATKFTPQYGDSFVEGVRLELINQWLSPIANYIWEETRSSYKPVKGERNDDRLTKYVTDVALAISVARSGDLTNKGLPKIAHRHVIPTVRRLLQPEIERSSTDLSELRLACANADPNYGSLWFYCRRRASDPPRKVIEFAAEHVAEDVQKYAHVYLAALIRRKAVLSMVEVTMPSTLEGTVETSDPGATEWEDHVEQQLLASPTLQDIFNPVDPTTGMVLFDSNVNGTLFVAGLTELNRHQPLSSMTLAARKRALFGNDALFP